MPKISKFLLFSLASFSLLLPNISSAQTSVCSSGQLFNVNTGAPCPGVVVVNGIASLTTGDTASCLEIQSTRLSYGMNDAQTQGEISKLQAFLKENGYLSTSIATTGSFGARTRDAVRLLQRDVLSGVLSTNIDSTRITLAEDRQTLASTGFLLSNTGTVGIYTKAKIAFLSCGAADLTDSLDSSSGTSGTSNTTNTTNTTNTGNQTSRSSLDGPVTCTVPTYIPNVLTNSTAAANGTCAITLTWPTSDQTSSKVLRWQIGSSGSWMGNILMTDASLTSLSKIFNIGTSPITVAIASSGTNVITKTLSAVCATGAVRNSAGRCVNTADSTTGALCTMEARLCQDGTVMPRDANCTWRPDRCSISSSTVTNTVTGTNQNTSSSQPTVSLSFNRTLISQTESAILTYNFSTPDVSAQSTMLCNVHFYDIATNSTRAKNSTYGNQQTTETILASNYPKGVNVDAVCRTVGGQDVRATASLAVTSSPSYCPDGTLKPTFSVGGGSTGCEGHEGAVGSYVAPDPTPVFTSSNFANGPYVAYGLMVNNAYIYSYLPLYTRTSSLVKSKNPKGCMQKMGASVCSSGSYTSSSFRIFTSSEWINGDTVQANLMDISSYEAGIYEMYIVYPTGGVMKVGSLTLVKPSLFSSNSPTGGFFRNGSASNDTSVYLRIEGVPRTDAPQGCMQALGATSCQNGGVFRSFTDPTTDAWLDHQVVRITIPDPKIFPVNTYELWLKYPGYSAVNVGTVTLVNGRVSTIKQNEKTLSSLTPSGKVLGDSASNVFCLDLVSNIHRGAESKEVTKLQTFLSQKGFLMESPSGFYGDKTIEAVKDYQASKGLPETGMVYDATRSVLKQETCTWQTIIN